MIPEHVARMQDELKELEERLEKLKTFTYGEVFAGLDAMDKQLLQEQSHHMANYARTLAVRIARA